MKDVIFLTPIVVVIIIGVIIVALSNYKLKKQILDAGPLDENALKFLSTLSSTGSELLKWGIILLFGGIGLVILEFLPYSISESPLPYGVEAIFLALGCLGYYFIDQRAKKKL